jgi:AbrB family looped-hinge helix DNA binding protein
MSSITPLRLSREGRILIPAPIRKQLHFEPNSEIVGRIEDGRLILESRTNVLRRLQDRLAHLPKDLMLSEELIADRREEPYFP